MSLKERREKMVSQLNNIKAQREQVEAQLEQLEASEQQHIGAIQTLNMLIQEADEAAKAKGETVEDDSND